METIGNMENTTIRHPNIRSSNRNRRNRTNPRNRGQHESMRDCGNCNTAPRRAPAQILRPTPQSQPLVKSSFAFCTSSLVIGFWLLVIGCWLLVVGYRLSVISTGSMTARSVSSPNRIFHFCAASTARVLTECCLASRASLLTLNGFSSPRMRNSGLPVSV